MEKRSKRTARKNGEASLRELFLGSLLSAGGGVLCMLLLLLGGTLACLSSSNPLALLPPVGIASLYLSSFVSGILASHRHKEAPLLCGALGGGWILLLCLILSLLPNLRGNFSLGLSLLLRGCIPIFSLLGARIGTRRKSPRRRRK